MKKNNTAEKAALDAEKITKALQESTEKSLKDLINEAISEVIAKEDEPEEGSEEDSYDVEDVESSETPEVSDDDSVENGGEEGGEGAAADNAEGADGDDADEWSDYEQYKVGDDDYDFTGVDGDEILKVYNKLGDDDELFVKKEDDGTYSVKDNETGAEFVIELNPENLDAASEEGGEEGNDISLELGDEPTSEPEGEDFSDNVDDLGGDDSLESGENSPEGGDDEIEIDLGDDDEDELNEENLGYTDSYQKNVFDKNISMNEPADGKATYSMDGGAPKDSEKPWAGKGDSKPFGDKKVDENVDECGGMGAAAQVPSSPDANLEENGGTIASTDARHMKKGQIGQHRPNAPEYSKRKEDSPLSESVKKIVAKAKAIQAENKQYKENLDKIKKSLYEAAVLNVNLGRLVDILVNETTTKDEKKQILTRFNNVKTINEGKELWVSIKSELKESKKSTAPIVEKQFVANSQSLNETTIYSSANDPSLDLMERMDNLYKK